MPVKKPDTQYAPVEESGFAPRGTEHEVHVVAGEVGDRWRGARGSVVERTEAVVVTEEAGGVVVAMVVAAKAVAVREGVVKVAVAEHEVHVVAGEVGDR